MSPNMSFTCSLTFALLLLLCIPLIDARPRPAEVERRQLVSSVVTLTLISPTSPSSASVEPTTEPTTTTTATTTTTEWTATTTTVATSPTPTCTPGEPAAGSWLDSIFGQGLDRILMNTASVYNSRIFPVLQKCDVIKSDVDEDLQRFYFLYHLAQNLIHEPALTGNLTAQGILSDAICDVLEAVHSLMSLVDFYGNSSCTSNLVSVAENGMSVGIWPCLQDSYPGDGSNKPFLFPQADLETKKPDVIAIAQGFGCRGNVVKRMMKRSEILSGVQRI
ncbi:uncharacterized protein SPPG_01357 [Spizellomyces punctatus DAOM BR117]|uniref:Uncharacterized protein n=1 Tax=Spizellomyces punctatus (strain DAOM BR117) TaxID=645134 RepID=A0A0L0HSL6_SPIPD|nr:uncharacterized protein SPPG_01357 [Spizellomyces punctatus DAOM BR117]KND03905.1 hypothetical protein SPPG_01357 [Spizellomyces punctatus DAOM BR117]|eukprot:XP_016611944.1 hypothetical protein SPPG_01357 [Spizellomyces punctatus DAOM BR117]